MKKLKQIGAWLAILLLVGFAAGALIFSLIDAPWAKTALSACLFCAIMVPVLLYAMILAARVLRRDPDDEKDSNKNTR